MARDTLASFITLFSTRVTTVGHNLSDYLHFQYQLVDVVRQSITPLLYEGASRHRGVVQLVAACVTTVTTSIACTTVHLPCCAPAASASVQRAGVRAAVVVTVKRLVFSSTDVDELSILANLRALGRAAVQTSESPGAARLGQR